MIVVTNLNFQQEDLFILYQYNCYYRIYSNTSIDRLTFRFAKKDIYNLNSTLNYTLAFFESELTAWEAFETFERNITDSDELYLEGTLTNLKPETDYYITIFEVEEELPPPPPPTPRDDDWFGLLLIILIPIIVVFIGLIIVVSKEEYLDFIKNRFANVNRGAHRLKMEEVLDNENRNKNISHISHSKQPIETSLKNILPLKTSVVDANSNDNKLFRFLLYQYHYLSFEN